MSRFALKLASTEPGTYISTTRQFKHAVVIDASNTVVPYPHPMFFDIGRSETQNAAQALKGVPHKGDDIVGSYEIVALEPLAGVAIEVEVSGIAFAITTYATNVNAGIVGATNVHLARAFPGNSAVSFNANDSTALKWRMV